MLKLVTIISLISFESMAFAVDVQPSFSDKVFNLPHFNTKITVDGNVDEAVWKKALSFDVNIETKPGENIEAPVKTTVYLYEDGENLNVAFIAYDPNPSEIRAHYHDHDYIFDDDIVGFKVDTFNDDQRAYQFFANALGVKHDSIENDVLGKDDMSWNAVWDAASKITSKGFQVEFSIPLRILRFDDSKTEQTWGFDVLRFYPRENFHRISHHKVDRNISCNLCQNASIRGFKNIKTGKNLSIVPFMTASQFEHKENPIVDDWTTENIEAEFGADIRWGITPDTTLNITVNPDFSQVESDAAQLNVNNAFSLFYPEKRQFFLEGSDYYQTLVNLVHTRNVSSPDYGLKLTHSSGGSNYAAFITNDTQINYILPGNTGSRIASYEADSINGVFRYRQDFSNASSLGAIVTIRDADDYHNYVFGLDGTYRFSDNDVLRGQILMSDTQDSDIIIDEFSLVEDQSRASAVDIHYRHGERDWLWWARYKRYDENFRADMGFLPEVDYQRYVVGFRRFWYPEGSNWWNKVATGFDWRIKHAINGQYLGKLLNGKVSFQASLQSSASFSIGKGDTFWNGIIYPQDYLNFEAKLTPFTGLTLKVYIRSLDSVDYENSQPGKSFLVSPEINYNWGQHFQTKIKLTQLSMEVSGGELFTSSILDARFIYQFSVQSFIRLIIQHRDTNRNQALYLDSVDANNKNLGTQLLYSYKINPQTVFFLGYSDSSYEDDTFNALKKTAKTFFMKMSYSWLY